MLENAEEETLIHFTGLFRISPYMFEKWEGYR